MSAISAIARCAQTVHSVKGVAQLTSDVFAREHAVFGTRLGYSAAPCFRHGGGDCRKFVVRVHTTPWHRVTTVSGVGGRMTCRGRRWWPHRRGCRRCDPSGRLWLRSSARSCSRSPSRRCRNGARSSPSDKENRLVCGAACSCWVSDEITSSLLVAAAYCMCLVCCPH